ncbi:MAG: UDP-N-acetylmuramyl-tripeptide synthetase [bacterium]|nr:UDP-N-acetylmuramyl-tripeptide synthetase [bacterium]
MMKRLFRKFVPAFVAGWYHWVLAHLANYRYHRPSEQLTVIGITGTSGKSTVAAMVASILEAAGHVVGVASTISFKVGASERPNDTKMTMVGRFQLQRLLAQMVKARCRFAIVETTSLGIAQSRHIGIHYDTAVLTNLYPEHVDAHGGFEKYVAAKRELFSHLERLPHKTIAHTRVPKTIIVNLDVAQAPEFLAFTVDKKIGVTMKARYDISGVEELRGEVLRDADRVGVRVQGEELWLSLRGEHNAENALMAAAIARAHGVSWADVRSGLANLATLPGRIERVDAGQPYTVIVDYAFEPVAMEKLYAVVRALPHRRVLQVLGTTGGGRDRNRGEVLGRMAGRFADYVVATNEDPYDDDPVMLANRVVTGSQAAGKTLGKDLFLELDRRQAIRQALQEAKATDVVLVTGKGSEQAMVVAGNKKVPWDDRAVVREEISTGTR